MRVPLRKLVKQHNVGLKELPLEGGGTFRDSNRRNGRVQKGQKLRLEDRSMKMSQVP